ncbi:hypothetical protein [Streptomyces tendae]|uniref:hypothetical protein n=1 Tax=Streptomyces tendae TaxID=1932 RepID=UPI003711C947
MPGLAVCSACRQHVRVTLSELPKLYLATETALARPARPMATERVSGSKYHGLPVNEAAVAARSDLLHLLAAWAGLVVDEFRLAAPARRTVDELAVFLARHLDRLLAHPAASDFIVELDAAGRAARRAVNGGPTRTVSVGSCPHPGCDSRVTVRFHAQDTTPHLVRCDVGHSWPARDWLLLAHMLDRTSGHRRESTAAGSAKGRR